MPIQHLLEDDESVVDRPSNAPEDSQVELCNKPNILPLGLG